MRTTGLDRGFLVVVGMRDEDNRGSIGSTVSQSTAAFERRREGSRGLQ